MKKSPCRAAITDTSPRTRPTRIPLILVQQLAIYPLGVLDEPIETEARDRVAPAGRPVALAERGVGEQRQDRIRQRRRVAGWSHEAHPTMIDDVAHAANVGADDWN